MVVFGGHVIGLTWY